MPAYPPLSGRRTASPVDLGIQVSPAQHYNSTIYLSRLWTVPVSGDTPLTLPPASHWPGDVAHLAERLFTKWDRVPHSGSGPATVPVPAAEPPPRAHPPTTRRRPAHTAERG